MNLSVYSQMREIWSEVFGDTSDYISLIFDNYFVEENVNFRMDNQKVTASMFAIPYSFGNARNNTISGQYLCGLATRPEYRKRGVMGEMIKEQEKRAKRSGIDLLFLIPADEHLRCYYSSFGYVNSSKVTKVKFDRDLINYVFDKCSDTKINNVEFRLLEDSFYIDSNSIPTLLLSSDLIIDKRSLGRLKSTLLWQSIIERICAEEYGCMYDTANRNSCIFNHNLDEHSAFLNEGKNTYSLIHSTKGVEILLLEKLQDNGVLLMSSKSHRNRDTSTIELDTIVCIDSENRIWKLAGIMQDALSLCLSYLVKTKLSNQDISYIKSECDMGVDESCMDPNKMSDKNELQKGESTADHKLVWTLILTSEEEKREYKDWLGLYGLEAPALIGKEENYGMVKVINKDLGIDESKVAFRLMLD